MTPPTAPRSISKTYRDGGGSGTIRSETDALAYALARMPATYAAVTASLNALCEIRPDFAPASLLDVGAGPGTASWAAAEAFPSLQSFTLLDANDALRALALDLVARQYAPARHAATNTARPAPRWPKPNQPTLSIASYMIGETSDAEQKALAELMWAKDQRYAAGRRTRYARRLCPDHRAARAIDRGRRACRRALPA